MISEQNKLDKSKATKASLAETRQRRKFQDCKVYELKFDLSHLSEAKKDSLRLIFLESKWLYNHILNQENIFDFDTKIEKVSALDKDRNPVIKEIVVLGSQMKQSICSRIKDSIISLSQLKKKGFKVGKLKFKSVINSIPLKQYGVTYKFHETKPNYIKIQNIKGYFKTSGIKQVPKNAELANATLTNKNENYYLKITCFVPKKQKVFKEKEVGIDFNIADNLVLSNGKKYKVNIPENRRSRRLRRKLSRKHGSKKGEKKSKSYFKNLKLLNKNITHTTNQKKDIKNKIVSELVNTYETICVQDESIKAWKDGWFGKQVHNSVLGGIMRDLKTKSHTLKIVDKFVPTTQLCLAPLPDGSRCFRLNKFGLEERIYSCVCGNVQERDPHSANNILEIGMGRVGIEEIKNNKIKPIKSKNNSDSALVDIKRFKTPMEELTTTICLGNSKSISEKLEATVL